ncbi:MAG: transcription initiation factor IIB family protein, partial [Natronomonas sp.]|nr:transcription initiation factor IIB family protein [Natronomonas sp.]
MRREQTRGRFQSNAERNLAHGLGEVRRIASVLEISDSIRDQACQLFRSAQTEDLLRGRSIEAIATASVYGACRCSGLSRTLDDVVDAARVEQSRVKSAYKTLNTDLGLPTQPVRPSEFIPRLASELSISDAIQRRAVALSKHHQETAISNGCRPSGVAAACIYKAAQEQGRPLTQQRVADAAGMSAV